MKFATGLLAALIAILCLTGGCASTSGNAFLGITGKTDEFSRSQYDTYAYRDTREVYESLENGKPDSRVGVVLKIPVRF